MKWWQRLATRAICVRTDVLIAILSGCLLAIPLGSHKIARFVNADLVSYLQATTVRGHVICPWDEHGVRRPQCKSLKDNLRRIDLLVMLSGATGLAGMALVIAGTIYRRRSTKGEGEGAPTVADAITTAHTAQDAIMARAERVFDAVELFLPKRYTSEELGDALEKIAKILDQGKPAWHANTKIVTSVMWVVIHAIQDILRGLPPKKGS